MSGECKLKVATFVLRRNPNGVTELLAHAFADDPTLPLRVPGGGVHPGEEPATAALRELAEETGLVALTIERKLGVRRYYKPFIQADVERHDFLLHAPPSTPDTWLSKVGGDEDDAGDTFHYRWLGVNDLALLDAEHQAYVTPALLPELF